MAQIPKLAFRCFVTKKPLGQGGPPQFEQHNYENLPGAWAYRDIALKRPNTKKVEILLVIDESTPEYR